MAAAAAAAAASGGTVVAAVECDNAGARDVFEAASRVAGAALRILGVSSAVREEINASAVTLWLWTSSFTTHQLSGTISRTTAMELYERLRVCSANVATSHRVPDAHDYATLLDETDAELQRWSRELMAAYVDWMNCTWPRAMRQRERVRGRFARTAGKSYVRVRIGPAAVHTPGRWRVLGRPPATPSDADSPPSSVLSDDFLSSVLSSSSADEPAWWQ
jgi:hypothetical protein